MAVRVGLILQARFGSSRLRGKALASLGGRSILERCLRRLCRARVGEVVLATTSQAEDDALAEIARRMDVAVFRGSTDDVLGRYLAAARAQAFDVIVRATGDNPAVDIGASRRLLHALDASGADYACEDGLPYGAGVEIFTMAALTTAAVRATDAADREHVTTYIKRHPDLFRVARVPAPPRLQRPDLRVTVDTAQDLAFMRELFARLRAPEPSLASIIAAADAWRSQPASVAGCVTPSPAGARERIDASRVAHTQREPVRAAG